MINNNLMQTDENYLLKFENNTTKDTVIKVLLLMLTGAVTGILSGFFGGGGGMLVVPALASVMKISEKQAHATAIAVILPITIVSAAVYGVRGVSLGQQFSIVLIGVVLGGLLGATLMNKISNELLSLIFYGMMIAAGIKMLF